MKFNKKLIFCLLMIPSAIGLSSCKDKIKEAKVGSLKDAKQFVQETYFDFTEQEPVRLFSITDGYSNKGVFGSTWVKENCLFDNQNGMRLATTVTDDEKEIKSDSGDPFLSAEIRTATNFQYGYFGTYMKPSNVVGTASTFFLYADNPHDEIDIEFLGKDTTKVQFNYFVNDQGGHEYWYDLGFDASLEYHHYGFYWSSTELCWYVDFQPVYRLVSGDMPTAKCQLLANHWVGASNDAGIMSWMGQADINDCPSYSSYKLWQIADVNGKAPTVKPKGNDYDVCPKDNVLVQKSVTFKSVTGYTITDKTSTNEFEITYTKEQITSDYRCLKLLVDGIENYKWCQVKIQNKKDHELLTRLTIDSLDEASGVTNNSQIKNIWKNGESSEWVKISNTTEAHLKLAANETAIFTVRWYGEKANELAFMFDCFGEVKTVDGHAIRDGHAIISDYKFGGVQDYVPIDHSKDVDELYTKNGVVEDPDSDQAEIPNGFTLYDMSLKGNSSYFSITKTGGQSTVNYNVGADNYEPVQNDGAINLPGVTEMIFTIKNNNKNECRFRIELRDETDETTKKIVTITSLTVISDISTGKSDGISSSSGWPYFIISGERRCQVKVTINGTINGMKLIPDVGGKPEQGSFTLMSVHAK